MSRHAKRKSSKLKRPKTKLGLPDLDHSKSAVLDSLRSPESKRGYRHAIDEFIQWYCSEPRLSFNKVVVTRYRIFLENRQLAAGTINGRLAAVRRLAYEAADAGLLSPELAASIMRVKGVRKLGVRLGNWPGGPGGPPSTTFYGSPADAMNQANAALSKAPGPAMVNAPPTSGQLTPGAPVPNAGPVPGPGGVMPMDPRSQAQIAGDAENVNPQSCPIQDEPEGELSFQHKMSLERVAC